jgi:hypothetical protein
MIGPLKIDKASVDMKRFLQSIMIVKNAGGKISRFTFKREMELLMNGTTMPEIEPENYRESTNERTPYNKSKLPRYFGFIKLTKSDTSRYSDLTLTKRGKVLADLIEQGENHCRIITGKENDFMKLVIESVLYDSFGKCNDGVEESKSDIEPPKALIKAIYLLGEITPEEFIYITWGLNQEWFESFDAAILKVKQLREELIDYTDFLTEKINELGMQNFIRDNKLIDFFVKNNLLIVENRDRRRYIKFNTALFDMYKNEIQQMNPIYRPLQMVLSGVPGTGKSYYVENSILGGVYDVNNVIRTIIHPDYSYSDFVGYIKPSSLGDSISYDFYPGPFTKALNQAIANEKVNVYLIIEEMNRGNISSVMGDTFQLLDRVDDFANPLHGWSRYAIENKDIYNYVKKNSGVSLNGKFPFNKVLIPSNLHIIGTMNTADQNVFVIDTAFRRRFRNLYLQIDYSEASVENSYLAKLDELSNQNIFDGSDGKTWSEFSKMINKKIDNFNKEFASIPEDKKLAPYFIDVSDLKDKRSFSDKVLFYLKTYVFKYTENILVESYQEIYNKIVINNGDPFELFEERVEIDE